MIIGTIARTTSNEAIAHWRSRLSRIAAAAFAMRSSIPMSQWSDDHRVLSQDLGEPGPWKTSRVPYLRAPMDAITDPRVRRVSIMKSARIGATQGVVVNTAMYYAHQEPTPILIALPTMEDAQKFSDKLLRPAIEDSPDVAALIYADLRKKRRNTMLQIPFVGGGIQIIGTTSGRTMRMVHARIILKSEIDAWIGSSGDDGDPYNVIDHRADSYGNPKYIEESTPLVRETSRIEPAFNAGSQEYFFVPCPHCKEAQRLVWGGAEVHYGLKWGRHRNGEPDYDNVYYVCQPNGCEITEPQKNAAVQAGDFVASHPERRDHRSFHLNALLSPFPGARWKLLLDEWYKTKSKPEKIRVFVNQVLGETYVEAGEQADADSLIQRRDLGDIVGYEDQERTLPIRELWHNPAAPVPAGAALVTRTVDTQGNRLETVVKAWGAGEECWILEHEILPGEPTTREPWDALDECRAKAYRHASGRDLIPRYTFIDRGGHHAKEVDAYCRQHQREGVYAIFGSKEQKKALLGPAKVNKETKAINYELGVFAAKEALLNRLEKLHMPGPGYIHIAPDIPDEQVHQLTAEKLIDLGERRIFKKMRARNEMTDMWGYGLACLHRHGQKIVYNLGAIAKRMMENPVQQTLPSPAVPAAPPARALPPTRRRRGVLSSGID